MPRQTRSAVSPEEIGDGLAGTSPPLPPPLPPETGGSRGEPETAKYGATLALGLTGPAEPTPRSPQPRSLRSTAVWRHFPQQRPAGLRRPRRQPRRVSRLTFLSRSVRTLLFPLLSKLRRLSSARKSMTRSSLSRRRFSDSELETPDPPTEAGSPCPAAD